ncbi:MAG TPA: hypothetical protein PLO61_08695 [Fimbriimonadaceae bacterium]|nr:hypothetical protein [Fimbriimonadaceae bacterium]HRJ33628.1 hypothetical protein [Fimbriimonadaceae bacterium]
MKKLFACLVAILAAALSHTRTSYVDGDWLIQIDYEGQTTLKDWYRGDDGGCYQRTETVPWLPSAAPFHGVTLSVGAEESGMYQNYEVSATASGKARVAMIHIGTQVPEEYIYVWISSRATALGAFDGVSCTASNGLGSKLEINNSNSIMSGDSDGRTYRRMYARNGVIIFDVPLSASSKANGISRFARAQTSFDLMVQVTDRAVDLFTNFDTSFRRGPGGVPIANTSRSVNEPVQRFDIGLDEFHRNELGIYHGFVAFNVSRNLYGGWSSNIDNQWYESYMDRHRQDVEDIDCNFIFFDHTIQGMKDQPIMTQINYTATDQRYEFTASAVGKVYIHLPLERTGEFWRAPYQGRLDQVLPTEYPLQYVGEAVNDSPSQAVANFTISSSFSFTATSSLALSVGLEIAPKIGTLNFGGEVTYSLTEAEIRTFTQGMSVTLPPFSSVSLYLGPVGTAEFPIFAHYGRQGFSGDWNVWNIRRNNLGSAMVIQ